MPKYFAHPTDPTMVFSVETLESGSFSPNPLILDPDLVYHPLEHTPRREEKKANSFDWIFFFKLFFLVLFGTLFYSGVYYIFIQSFPLPNGTTTNEVVSPPTVNVEIVGDNVTDLKSQMFESQGTIYLTSQTIEANSEHFFRNVKQLILIKKGNKTKYDLVTDNDLLDASSLVLYTPLTNYNPSIDEVSLITVKYSLEVAAVRDGPWKTIVFERKFIPETD